MSDNPNDKHIKQVLILKHNQGMIRDCWFEEKDGQEWLVIRQINFESGGTSGIINKHFRFDVEEAEQLREFIENQQLGEKHGKAS